MRPSSSTAVLLLALALLGACGRETRIKVSITGSEAIGVDSFQLRVEDRFGVAEALSALELVVPDEMAGTDAKVELWGLRAGDQVAYGAAVITPSLHGTTNVTVTLGAITCGTWCQPGSTTCAVGGAGDGTATCVQAADGCLSWSATMACPTATPFCSNGSCGATCSDECTAGAMECSGSVATRRCGQFDSDACLDWSAATGCGAGQTCTAGVCSSGQTCNAGDDCDDGQACTDGDSCSGGVCAGDPRVCADKPPECVSPATLRMYGLGGTCSASTGDCSYSYIDATCPRGCTNGACNPQVGAGGNNSCGIRSTGALACWGEMLNSSLPAGTFSAISVRQYHGCGTTTAGATVCWRRQTFDNFYGEVDVPTGTFTSVSTGEVFTCAIRTTGAIACWGDSASGKLIAPAGTFTQVSAGVDHSCAVRTNGTAVCWGANEVGQSTALSGAFAQVTAGYQYSCGIRPGGLIECWGSIAAPPPGSYVGVSAGRDHACAVRADGVPKCWGNNASSKATPPSGTFTSVVAADQHTCGMRTSGTIACWGNASQGATSVPSGL